MPLTWTDPLVQPKHWKRDIIFGTWNIRSPYRLGSLTTAARELAKYKSDVVGVEEVRWDKVGMLRAGDYFFSMEKGTKIIKWKQDFFVQHRIVSAVNSVKSVSHRMSHIALRSRWCNIILNVHAQSTEKNDDSKHSFYEESEQVIYHIPKYYMKILLDFSFLLGIK